MTERGQQPTTASDAVDTQTIVNLFIPFTLMTIMLAMGLGLEIKDFKPCKIFRKSHDIWKSKSIFS